VYFQKSRGDLNSVFSFGASFSCGPVNYHLISKGVKRIEVYYTANLVCGHVTAIVKT